MRVLIKQSRDALGVEVASGAFTIDDRLGYVHELVAELFSSVEPHGWDFEWIKREMAAIGGKVDALFDTMEETESEAEGPVVEVNGGSEAPASHTHMPAL